MPASPMSPRAAGFHMPAEWSPHDGCWMMWPCRQGVWADIAATRRDCAAVAHAIAHYEPVTMAVRAEHEAGARHLLGADITLVVTPIDDSWARDAGPCFLVDGAGHRAGVNFRFNAWGGKYHPCDHDDAFSAFVLEHVGARQFHSSLVAEGGGISVDGEGTLLTTESCFPNANRNPGWSRPRIENELVEMLGVEKVVWLPGNAEETETDGHVDGIAQFAAPGVVLVEDGDQRGDPWGAIKRRNIRALDGQVDARARPIRLLKTPEALEASDRGENFCRSYVNFYIANGAVIMPKYSVRADDIAREILADAFPDRDIVAVPIDSLACGGGGIHCITQQVPSIGDHAAR